MFQSNPALRTWTIIIIALISALNKVSMLSYVLGIYKTAFKPPTPHQKKTPNELTFGV